MAFEDEVPADPGRRSPMWGEMADVLVRGFAGIHTRFDRLEGDVAVLKGDVAVLKADMAETKHRVGNLEQQLNRFELATERRFNRVDARIEVMAGLVGTDELTP